MNVVPFKPVTARSLRSWSAHELETLVSIYAAHATRGDAVAWDIGATEFDDPQFFILGPAPDFACIVAVARVGGIYILENGTGQLLEEGASLETLGARAKMPATSFRPVSLLARITLSLTGLRLTIEEKIEPVLVESEELLLRFAPQLAAFV
jgi:hypothetical protein